MARCHPAPPARRRSRTSRQRPHAPAVSPAARAGRPPRPPPGRSVGVAARLRPRSRRGRVGQPLQDADRQARPREPARRRRGPARQVARSSTAPSSYPCSPIVCRLSRLRVAPASSSSTSRSRARARCSRDFTVPRGQPRTAADSASSRSRRYRHVTTWRCGGESLARPRTSASCRSCDNVASAGSSGRASSSRSASAQDRCSRAARRPDGTVQVPGLVRDDLQQPWPERRSGAEPVQRCVRLDEGLLHDVLRVSAGTEQGGRAQRYRGMAVHQLRVRVAVAAAYPGQQVGVVRADVQVRVSLSRPICVHHRRADGSGAGGADPVRGTR